MLDWNVGAICAAALSLLIGVADAKVIGGGTEWRDYATKGELKSAGWDMEMFTQDSAWIALNERACGQSVPEEDSQAGFLSPVIERGILSDNEPLLDVFLRKYHANEDLFVQVFEKCDEKELAFLRNQRSQYFVKIELIKVNVIIRELKLRAHQ